ncbi:tripartite tricarboxylate transporter substrate binding protein, partial [Acinetobacter faecalis]|nr:tripartite tricarboxylate transporter substrate binding protein [Acinetobacter faecalis]
DLLPLTLTGDELTQYVYNQTNQLRELSKEYELIGK